MALLETILIAALGSGITALAVLLQKNGVAQLLLKHGTLIEKAYNIIDPILDNNIHNWNGSQVDQTFELVVESLSDGNLSPSEIKEVAVFMAKAWLPAAAADKVRLLEAAGVPADEAAIADEVTQKVIAEA